MEAYDQNIPVDLAVLDFSKAFDVVSHPKLLLKMKAIGIHLYLQLDIWLVIQPTTRSDS